MLCPRIIIYLSQYDLLSHDLKVPYACFVVMTDEYFDVLNEYQYLNYRKLMPPVTTMAELQQIQADYFSFLTVRHPLERILSAYRDKFFSLSEVSAERKKAAKFYKLYGREIISNYRVRTNNTSELDPKYISPKA